ncbi:DUF4192 family protein [Microbacterium trichothecenolyticum]|uniref:DUF4192 family protein n=1 Tax=Microbacterium trichothecenolyticum TaxID=69370 RepID=A0ABU0TX16_MICTR|nr:DUF4192 family protein [Microbacterium trichothecenolyticum]MDQ1123499.1 hypothetical protein [Microbacterium trichothecenolyticum]
MTTTVVRASSSSSFLALVPRLLECTPQRSLVIVPFGHGRSLGALRVDLPSGSTPAEVEGIGSTVIGMACKIARTDAIALAVYTEDQVAGQSPLPHRAVVDTVIARADICGLRIVDALVVGPDAWNSYLDPSSAAGRPLAEIGAGVVDVPGPPVAADQFSAAALPDVDAELARSVSRLLDDVDRVLSRPRGGARLDDERRRAADDVVTVLADPPALLEEAVRASPGDLSPAQLAAVAFCLERPALRDVALMQWTADITVGDAVFEAQTTFGEGSPFPADLARPMWGEGAAPDIDRLRDALELCRRIAGLLPRVRRPGTLSACAWLAWATGRSSHAGTYAQAAIEIDSTHGLSSIVMTMLDAGRLPEWVFEPPTSRAGRGSSRGSRAR